MTPKQILDSFSETLMQDERILSAQERALLKNLIQHARSASIEPETHEVVNATIASAVGETVAQRAFAVLGSSIVERILGSSGSGLTNFMGVEDAAVSTGELSSPGQPRPPRPKPQPRPSEPAPRPEEIPIPLPPGPPGISATKRSAAKTTPVLERPDVLSAQCVVLDEFLAPQELQELIRFTLKHEADFCMSEVVGRDSSESVVNEEHRRSRVLVDLENYQEMILSRIRSALPLVLNKLGMEEFFITNAEAQITASNHGDFFSSHSDNGDPTTAARQLTFVYFFHREPRQFSGGDLRIHDRCREDSLSDGNREISIGGYQTIMPQQNQIVFFPCSAMHEITPVTCPSWLFADSRFTLNGWLHK
ncbi:MAG TPA: 2OG-Fe(II) oxygenase [Candidatus Sulfotelmatobacter sp.]|jgi:SM-20-related protein